MTLHEHPQGIAVMDGSRFVAVARKKAIGIWLLRLYGGCWVDARTDQVKLSSLVRLRLLPSASTDNLKVARTRAEARALMEGLLGPSRADASVARSSLPTPEPLS